MNYLRRDSKGAGVNDLPVAGQSRAPARPQAGSPVRVTKKTAPPKVGLFFELSAWLFQKTGTEISVPVF